MIPAAPYALHALPSASSFAGSHFSAAWAAAGLYGMLPCAEGLGPAPMNPTPGFSIVPATPLPKSPFPAVNMRTCQSSVITAVQYPVRSIGARAFGVEGGAPRPRPAWAWIIEDPASHTSAAASTNRHAVRLVNGFPDLRAPGLAVGGSRDPDQASTRAVGTARGVDDEFDRIPDLECVLVDALLRKLRRSRSLDHPPLQGPRGVLDLHIQKRVRRSQRHLHH